MYTTKLNYPTKQKIMKQKKIRVHGPWSRFGVVEQINIIKNIPPCIRVPRVLFLLCTFVVHTAHSNVQTQITKMDWGIRFASKIKGVSLPILPLGVHTLIALFFRLGFKERLNSARVSCFTGLRS